MRTWKQLKQEIASPKSWFISIWYKDGTKEVKSFFGAYGKALNYARVLKEDTCADTIILSSVEPQ